MPPEPPLSLAKFVPNPVLRSPLLGSILSAVELPMKTALKWLVVCIFAFQVSGGMWYAHLACCDEPDGQDAARRHDPACGLDVHAPAAIEREADNPSGPGKPSHHHDPQTCGICQAFLTLSATASIPAALPTSAQAVMPKPMPADRPFVDVRLASIDARGPPVSSLLTVPVS
jgi:hypothetical protein